MLEDIIATQERINIQDGEDTESWISTTLDYEYDSFASNPFGEIEPGTPNINERSAGKTLEDRLDHEYLNERSAGKTLEDRLDHE